MSLKQVYKGVHAALVGDITVNALVSGNVFAVLIPQGTDLPAITFDQIDAVSNPDNTDDYGLVRSRFEINSYADDYAQAQELARAIDNVFNGDAGTYEDAGVERVMRDSGPQDLADRDGDKVIFRVSLNYIFIYSESDADQEPEPEPGILPTFHAPFYSTSSLVPTVGPTLTCTRASTATFVDADGIIREVQENEARFPGATYDGQNVLSYSSILDGTGWTAANSSVTGYVLTFSTVWGKLTGTAIGGCRVGHTYTGSVTLSGTGTVAIQMQNNDGIVTNTIALTATPTRYHVSYTIPTTGTWLSFIISRNNGSATEVTVGEAQLEDVTGKVDSNPSEYLPTTTVPVTSLSGTSDGLLVEEARTNICLYSSDLSQTWLNFRSVDTQNEGTAPDGTNTANKLQDDGAGGTSSINVYQSVTVATSTTHTYSCFLKADQLSKAWLYCENFTTPSNSGAWFDLAAGSVLTVDAGFDDSGIEDIGNGWYRCWVVFTTDPTDNFGQIIVGPAESDGSTSVTRDGTSSIFVWGAQLEVGAFPTSPIPTAGSTVTRAKDLITATTGIDTVYNPTEGTLYTAFSQPYPTANRHAANMTNSGYTDFLRISTMVVGPLVRWWGATAVSGNVWLPGVVTVTANTIYKTAGAYAINDAQHYVNGVAANPDTTVPDLPLNVSLLEVGSGNNGASSSYLNGTIQEIRYYDTRLDDTVLEDMSNGIFP